LILHAAARLKKELAANAGVGIQNTEFRIQNSGAYTLGNPAGKADCVHSVF
jgi:hypothetical protein